MAFLTDISTSRHFPLRRRAAGAGIDRARLGRRAVSAVKQACEIVAALAFIAAIMTALAFLELWIWMPTLPK
jgi:hypothetical protein